MERYERGRDRRPPSSRRSRTRRRARPSRLQEEAGIDVLTDGEMRRRFWFDPLTASLAATTRRARAGAVPRRRAAGRRAAAALPAVTGARAAATTCR